MKKFCVCLLLTLIMSLPAIPEAQEARTLILDGLAYYEEGNCLEALANLEPVLAAGLPELEKNPHLLYSLNYYTGHCAKSTGNFDGAYAYLNKALSLAYELNIQDQLPVINTFLGEVEREREFYRSAASFYKKALSYLAPKSVDAGTVWYFLAEAQRAAKDYKEALESCEKAMDIAKLHGLIKLEISCMTSSGEVYNETGDYQQAIKAFTHALTTAKNAHMPVESANNHLGIGLVYQALGKNDLARQSYDEALKLYIACANTVNLPLLVDRLTSLPPCNKAQAEKALDSYRHLVEYSESIHDEEAVLQLKILIAHYRTLA